MGHHEFSPSRLEQFRICPGSYYMQKGIPERESEWAKEGQKLHYAVATRCLDGLSAEQQMSVQRCLDFLDSLIQPGDTVHHEILLYIGDITYGTADVVIEHQSSDISTIDWKFGYNPVKDVRKNIQMATYSAGAMMMFQKKRCMSHVFQPRISHHSNYMFRDIDAIIANIQSIIARAKDDRMILNPSEESCRYCNAEYLDYLASGKKLDLADEAAVASYMKGLSESNPELFHSSAKSGGGTGIQKRTQKPAAEEGAATHATDKVSSIVDLLGSAPSVE